MLTIQFPSRDPSEKNREPHRFRFDFHLPTYQITHLPNYSITKCDDPATLTWGHTRTRTRVRNVPSELSSGSAFSSLCRQVGKPAMSGDELLWRTLFQNAAFVEDDDVVSVFHHGIPMSNQQRW